jgi:outer membrane autotransporter protein
VLFSDVAQTPNQIATADGVDTMPHGNDVWQQIIGMNADQARNAFDALSGEFHPNLNAGGYDDVLRMMSAVQDRMNNAGVAQAIGSSMYASLATPTSDAGAGPGGMQRTVWGEVLADWGNVSGDGNAARFDYDRSGVVFGADWGVAGQGLFGVAISYRDMDATEDARLSHGDVRSIDASLYAGTRFGGLALSAQGGTSWRTVNTNRHVVVGTLDQNLTADYDANVWHAQVRAGAPFESGNSTFEPFVSLAYVSVDADSFIEQGGSAALSGKSDVQSATFASVGVRGEHALGAGGRMGELFGSLAYSHANGDLNAIDTMRFVVNPAASFDVAGAPISINSITLEAGLRLALTDHLNLTAAYHGESGDSDHSQGVNVRLAFSY